MRFVEQSTARHRLTAIEASTFPTMRKDAREKLLRNLEKSAYKREAKKVELKDIASLLSGGPISGGK